MTTTVNLIEAQAQFFEKKFYQVTFDLNPFRIRQLKNTGETTPHS
jgi:hypothetical protein